MPEDRPDELLESRLEALMREGLTRRALLRAAAAGGGAAALGGALAGPAAAFTNAAAASAPKRGGTLRVGVVGGGSGETLDPNTSHSEIDVARIVNLYEGLADFDAHGKPYPVLAQELSPNKNASVWTIKLRDDVVFHNGKSMTADDVVYTLRYVLTPSNKAQGAGAFQGFLVPSGVRKVDKHTVRLVLQQPNAFLLDVFAGRTVKIAPSGATARSLANKPVGTGPFKFKSWTRGERSMFVANRNYRFHNGPYVNALEFVSFNDPTAMVNALAAGQIDAASQLDPTLVPVVKGNSKLKLLEIGGAPYTCQYMQVTAAPFTDQRVRQAMRLLVDREQMVQNALGGHGRVGNDLSSWFDPDYDTALPQRQHDPEQAKSLLKAAGQENLTVTLSTASAAPGMLESSTLLAQQAKAAGVTINLNQVPADQYYAGPYLHVPFACTNWGGWLIAQQWLLALTSNAPYNETAWNVPSWNKAVTQAFATADDKKRKELLFAAQRQLYNDGGYIIWGFLNNIDAISNKLHGVVPSVLRNLGFYKFNDVYLA